MGLRRFVMVYKKTPTHGPLMSLCSQLSKEPLQIFFYSSKQQTQPEAVELSLGQIYLGPPYPCFATIRLEVFLAKDSSRLISSFAGTKIRTTATEPMLGWEKSIPGRNKGTILNVSKWQTSEEFCLVGLNTGGESSENTCIPSKRIHTPMGE